MRKLNTHGVCKDPGMEDFQFQLQHGKSLKLSLLHLYKKNVDKLKIKNFFEPIRQLRSQNKPALAIRRDRYMEGHPAKIYLPETEAAGTINW